MVVAAKVVADPSSATLVSIRVGRRHLKMVICAVERVSTAGQSGQEAGAAISPCRGRSKSGLAAADLTSERLPAGVHAAHILRVGPKNWG